MSRREEDGAERRRKEQKEGGGSRRKEDGETEGGWRDGRRMDRWKEDGAEGRRVEQKGGGWSRRKDGGEGRRIEGWKWASERWSCLLPQSEGEMGVGAPGVNTAAAWQDRLM